MIQNMTLYQSLVLKLLTAILWRLIFNNNGSRNRGAYAAGTWETINKGHESLVQEVEKNWS